MVVFQLKMVIDNLRDFALIPVSLGAAAIDLCYVACGRIDGFFEYNLQAWDCAAAILIIEEAGGRVTNFSGGAYNYADKKIVATNGHLHAQMLEMIGRV